MLNQSVIVGKLVGEPVLTTEDEKKLTYITIAVKRTFKNVDGIYEDDFIPVRLWNAIAENTMEYCHNGDVLGVKGRLETHIIEKEDGTKEYKLELIAEKVTFLSSSKKEEEK